MARRDSAQVWCRAGAQQQQQHRAPKLAAHGVAHMRTAGVMSLRAAQSGIGGMADVSTSTA